MHVYIEEVFLSNVLITFVILYLTAKICKYFNKKRIILASIVGAILSTFYPIIHQSLVILPFFYKTVTALVIILISFRWKGYKSFAFNMATFLLITGLFGGIILAIEYFSLIKTIPLYISALIILIFSYLISVWFNKVYLKEKITNYLYKTKLVLGEKIFEFEAYLDSGNTLIDPITNKPIIIVTPTVLQMIYKNISYADILLGKVDKIRGAHYIEFSTAYKGGKMLVFEVDKLLIMDKTSNKEITQIYCGVSYSSFAKRLNCQLLLNPFLF